MPEQNARQTYGTFAGVFTPTILTILGVIMYLRLGWVVGNAGLLGAWMIMAIAIGITFCTGLSLSSIATNTRLGAGGPYAIISKSLGLEVGGSVGIPLYLSQALAVSMYIFGFREGFMVIYDGIPAIVVDFAIFGVVFGVAMVSANLAFQIQYFVMAVIVLSLVLILGSPVGWEAGHDIQWWGEFAGAPDTNPPFKGTEFWAVFAVFFPAATGVMAGANMSGDLSDPRRNIPIGTMSAIVLSAVVYFALSLWVARAGTPEELTQNYNFMMESSLWPPGVIAGLLGATFSSALASMVGAPRILLALGGDNLLPKGEWIAEPSADGEPRRAMLLTGILVAAALMLRDLNLVAPLISMFFLISYAVINLVVLVEKSLGLSSFRPTLNVPWVIPFVGAVGCVFAMFIVNPAVSLIACALVVGLFFMMMRRGLRKTEDVRSGIFAAFAEWAAAKVIQLDIENAKAWKPSLLVPVEDPSQLRGEIRFLSDICRPEGSVKLIGIASGESVERLTERTAELGEYMRRQDLFTTWSILDSLAFKEGLVSGLQALNSAFFRPNILFLNFTEEAEAEKVRDMCVEARRLGVGVLMLAMHPKAGLGRAGVINLWFSFESSDRDAEAELAFQNMHLATLMAWRLARAWKGELNVILVVKSEDEQPAAMRFFNSYRDLVRLPSQARPIVMVGDIESCMPKAPQSDLDILGVDPEPDMAFVARTVALTRSSCLFAGDSGKESAVA